MRKITIELYDEEVVEMERLLKVFKAETIEELVTMIVIDKMNECINERII